MHRGLAPILLLGVLFSVATTSASEKCLVIGDSLTKEYEAWFPGYYPSNPAAWATRNWSEILHQHRTDWFDTGNYQTWAPPRTLGHKHNWAFPGAKASDIRDRLTIDGIFRSGSAFSRTRSRPRSIVS
jgi:hypothetical protein